MRQRSAAKAAKRLKSHGRNILPPSPDFPRFYADVLMSKSCNPNEIRDLAEQIKKNLVPISGLDNA
jgi:hypothetical protein